MSGINLSLLKSDAINGYSLKEVRKFVSKLGRLSALDNWLKGKEVNYIDGQAVISSIELSQLLGSMDVLYANARLTRPLDQSNIDM